MASLDAVRQPRCGTGRALAAVELETFEHWPLVAVVLPPLVLLLRLLATGFAARLAPLRRGAADLKRQRRRDQITQLCQPLAGKGKSARRRPRKRTKGTDGLPAG